MPREVRQEVIFVFLQLCVVQHIKIYKDWLSGIDFSQDTDFQQQLVSRAPSKDVKKYLLATSEFGEEIQGETDFYVTNSRPNDASFRRKLNLISENIKNQNRIFYSKP